MADDGEHLRTAAWCPGAESNHRHCDFQSHALPTELPGHFQSARELGAGVYSQARLSCPPWFALAMRSAVVWDEIKSNQASYRRFRALPVVSPYFPDTNRCGSAWTRTNPRRRLAPRARGW